MRRRYSVGKRHLFYFCVAVVCFVFFAFLAHSQFFRGWKKGKSGEFLYGITVDDSWEERVSTDQVVDAIREMPMKPTVRIVMSADVPPSEYRTLFSEIKRVADVMASPVDSYYMSLYGDSESYLHRFRESYEALSEYVDIWEIGNEINGTEWIGQDSVLIVEKVSTAANFIRSKGGKTALTFYYTDPAKADLFQWISEYCSDAWIQTLDYVFLSYYEDDNDGYLPEWNAVFSELEKRFPNAKLGIGDCGNTAEDATVSSKMKMARDYYSMTISSENFVGGFFWWNWVEDCVPHEENRVYQEMNRCMEGRK